MVEETAKSSPRTRVGDGEGLPSHEPERSGVAVRGWRVAVDTGGTFTDCVAIDPEGLFRRLKVLSSGRLRAVVREILGPRQARIELKHPVPDGFFVGYRVGWPLRVATSNSEPVGTSENATVVWSSGDGQLAVDKDLFRGSDSSRRCELWSDEPAPVLGARLLTGIALAQALPDIELRLGTTRGTNALLERQGVATALFVTRGFGDLLEIGTQARPDLFALAIEKPLALHEEVVEVTERLDRDGRVLEPLDLDSLTDSATRLVERGIRSAAIALMHSYRNPAHEQALAQHLLRCGFEHVSCSADLAPLIKILPRAQTAVVDAYLAPIISGYLSSIRRALASDKIWVMTSAGGLSKSTEYRAKDSLLSGPAGGVVGAVAGGRSAGFERLLTFDMGGTSTDVARFGGDYEYVYEHRVGDASIVAPALYIETVAAGGGSICRLEEGEPRVGPESAGADPGPACYGAGGPLTLTDVNLLLGRLDPGRFEIPLDPEAARRAASEELASAPDPDPGLSLDDLLAGFLQVANERMADAMRRVSVQQGYDPADHALVAFGGAGAQHACAIADLLGMSQIIVPPDASLLSALGLQNAVLERFAQRQVLRELPDVLMDGSLSQVIAELDAEARSSLAAEGVPAPEQRIRRRIVRMRFLGQESALDVEADMKGGSGTLEWLGPKFSAHYEATFGYLPTRSIEVESVRVVASTDSTATSGASPESMAGGAPLHENRSAYFVGRRQRVSVLERCGLQPGEDYHGPCLVVERHSTTVVEPGWRVRKHSKGALLVQK